MSSSELFVLLREAPALVDEQAQVRVAFDDERMDPGEIEPDLQIAQIVLLEAPQGFAGRVLAGGPPQVKLLVAGEGGDHVMRIGHEEVVEQIEAIRLGQIVGRDSRDLQGPIGRPAIGIGLNLHQQARHQVDGAVHGREFEQVQGHADIIFDAVQPNPGHGVLTADVVGIIGLVLVPVKGNGKVGHQISLAGRRSEVVNGEPGA